MAQVHKTARVLGFMFWAGFGGFGSLFWVSGSTPCFTIVRCIEWYGMKLYDFVLYCAALYCPVIVLCFVHFILVCSIPFHRRMLYDYTYIYIYVNMKLLYIILCIMSYIIW